MAWVKGKLGLTEAPGVVEEKRARSPEIVSIRGLNKDYMDLGCEQTPTTVPCRNIIEAMKRLSLPVEVPTPTEPSIQLGPPVVASKPPKLVLQTDADAQATCTKRCGVFGAVLGSALATTALTSPALSDLGVADQQKEIVAQAGAAAASVLAVAFCSRICEPNRNQKTFEAPGVGYKLTGTYVHEAPTKSDLDTFKAYVANAKPDK